MLGRAGAEIGSSPKRSTFCGCRVTREAGAAADADARCDVDRSIFAFSCTTLRGYQDQCSAQVSAEQTILTTSSSPSTSNVEGSGMGPSMVHRFDSYFVRIKFSILASAGTWPGANFASQYLSQCQRCRYVPHVHGSLVRPRIAPLQHALQLFVRPRVQVDRFDSADVRSHATVYT